MYQTIQLSSCVSVQGEFVERLCDGQVLIRDGKTMYRGRPIQRCGADVSMAAIARVSEHPLHTN
jgi:hypothetical protein